MIDAPHNANDRSAAAAGNRPRGRVLYLAPGDVAKGRVEPISWMRTCLAYAQEGFDVTLVSLRVQRPDAIDEREIWPHYGVPPVFRLVVFPTRLRRDFTTSRFRLWAGAVAAIYAAGLTAQQAVRPRPTIMHARVPVLTIPFVVLRRLLPKARRPTIVLETHSLPKPEHRWLVRQADLVVTNSQKLADDLRREFGMPDGRVLHAPLGPYNDVVPVPKVEARKRVGLPKDAVIACYTGKMSREHNEFLLRTARELRGRGILFVLVGGNPEILEWTRARMRMLKLTDDVQLTGFVAPTDVTAYQSAADVLVYHMPDSMEIFPYCTPAKGFEYQAAERPIVATDIPLFDEVFGAQSGERAIRVDRTPLALAGGIVVALELPDRGEEMTRRAAAWVRGRTWRRRTQQILGAAGFEDGDGAADES